MVLIVESNPIVFVRGARVENGPVLQGLREAGPKHAPTVLLLHGFPTGSQMFRKLVPPLAAGYHVVAPDYPGFGPSSMAPRDQFTCTFDNLAKAIDDTAERVGLAKYALYVQDYGALVGFRLAAAYSERHRDRRPERQRLSREAGRLSEAD